MGKAEGLQDGGIGPGAVERKRGTVERANRFPEMPRFLQHGRRDRRDGGDARVGQQMIARRVDLRHVAEPGQDRGRARIEARLVRVPREVDVRMVLRQTGELRFDIRKPEETGRRQHRLVPCHLPDEQRRAVDQGAVEFRKAPVVLDPQQVRLRPKHVVRKREAGQAVRHVRLRTAEPEQHVVHETHRVQPHVDPGNAGPVERAPRPL